VEFGERSFAGSVSSAQFQSVVTHIQRYSCATLLSIGLSRTFEIVWDCYIAYCVRNESYVVIDDSERSVGSRFRTYSSSNFMKYISIATFATDQYPGPTQDHEVCCEDQLVGVMSTVAPSINETPVIAD
jgi:hypothetical protein